MSRRIDHKTYTRAYHLRHAPTEAETKLWRVLRAHQLENVHFRRQQIVGPYIVDFCAPRRKLVIELDGGQHLEREEYDQQRTAYLEAKGFRVVRFWNNDILNDLDNVVRVIIDALS